MENEVTEPDRRIKPQGKSVWAASFRKNFKIRRQFQQQLHQTGALHWNYIKSGCGKTLWNTVHVEIQPENVFWMLPSSFKPLILPFNFIFKRCVYLMKSQGEDIFILSFHPAPFLVLCFAITVIPTRFSVPRCTPSPLQQFWGLWCTVLQTSAGF